MTALARAKASSGLEEGRVGSGGQHVGVVVCLDAQHTAAVERLQCGLGEVSRIGGPGNGVGHLAGSAKAHIAFLGRQEGLVQDYQTRVVVGQSAHRQHGLRGVGMT